MKLGYVSFLFLVGFSSAATFLKYLPEKPKELAHLSGCYIEEIKNVLPYGDEITQPGECIRISCARRYIEYATCGVIDPSSPCLPVKNKSLSYPECCQSNYELQAYSYNSASRISPYDAHCRAMKSCFACKHSQYDCHWCHDYGCTSKPRLFCPKKVYLDLILNRRKLSHCSEIQADTSLIIPAQVSKNIQLYLQVDDLTLYDRPLSCEFNVEGRITEVSALVKNKTVYCDPVVLNTKKNISMAYARLVWGGADPYSNKILVVVYRCNALAGSCGECRALTKFDCGWCIDTNQCSASEQCPRHAGPWVNRLRTCSNTYYKTNLVTFNYNRLNKMF